MKRCLLVALLALALPATSSAALVAADDQAACGAGNLGFVSAHRASVMRYVLAPGHFGEATVARCLSAARAAHFRVYLSVIYDNQWSPQQVAAYFARVLRTYGEPWAISVGNEQELQLPLFGTDRAYRRVWNAVWPVIARVAPHAIRVFGETSGWGVTSIKTAFGRRAPGAQAIAFHCYRDKRYKLGLDYAPDFARWAAAHHLPLWCSEMAPATTGWGPTDTPATWRYRIARALRYAPNLKLVSYYRWPYWSAY